MAPGLRDAKRTAVAQRLAATAFDQVRERGFGAVTVDDVVAEAEVSRRTFSNYYSCKEAAVAAVVVHRVEAALREWRPPAAGDPLKLVSDLVEHQIRVGSFHSLTEVARLAVGHPQLVPFVREAQWQLWVAVGDRVLECLPQASDDDRETVRLAVGALFGLVSASLLGAGDRSEALTIRAAVRRGISRLATGLRRDAQSHP
jgi:AcrR family transcriptional regulator